MPTSRALLGWANVNPTSGSGNQVISVNTEAAYTGRVQRQTTVTVAATGVDTPQDVVIKQKAIPEYVDLQASATIDKAGGTLTITGKSNSAKLTFALTAPAENVLDLTLPATYTVNGAQVSNGEAIEGDPGADAEYEFSVVFTGIPANATIGDLTNQLDVTTEGGQTDSCPITQSAGDPTLSVSTNEIILEASGEAKTFNVISNTSWTIKDKAVEGA